MNYAGMTVNERLFESGNLDKFDEAVNDKDKEAVIRILKEVDVSDSNILPILKHFGLE